MPFYGPRWFRLASLNRTGLKKNTVSLNETIIYPMTKKKFSIILLVSIGLLIFVACSASVQANKEARIYADPYKENVDFYNTEVASEMMSGGERKTTAKMQPFIENATQHAEAELQRVEGTEPTINRTPYPIQVYKLPDGIDEYPPMPLHFYTNVKLTNAWRRTVGSTTYLVYAGVLKADRSQGIVLLQDPDTFGFYTILSPQKAGELRIRDYKDFTVMLRNGAWRDIIL